MAQPYAMPFYNSPAWRKCRKGYIIQRQSIDGGLCEHCKKELGYIVDHIKEISPDNIHDPYITLGHDNLQFLCLACHNTKTFGKQEEQRYVFDSDGMIQPTPPPEIEN